MKSISFYPLLQEDSGLFCERQGFRLGLALQVNAQGLAGADAPGARAGGGRFALRLEQATHQALGRMVLIQHGAAKLLQRLAQPAEQIRIQAETLGAQPAGLAGQVQHQRLIATALGLHAQLQGQTAGPIVVAGIEQKENPPAGGIGKKRPRAGRVNPRPAAG